MCIRDSLEDVLNFDELYEAYPSLRKMYILAYKNRKDSARGYYDSVERSIAKMCIRDRVQAVRDAPGMEGMENLYSNTVASALGKMCIRDRWMWVRTCAVPPSSSFTFPSFPIRPVSYTHLPP